jgi:ATP-dependent RNA helicase SUPV3L1/SUV3
LSIAEAKQIAGRAGRYRTAPQAIKKDLATTNLDIAPEALVAAGQATSASSAPPVPEEPTVGLVTTLDSIDFPIIERAMSSEPEPMPSAGIQPPAYIIERFAKMYPAGTPFAYLLIRLNDIARTTGRFHLCELKQAIAIADAIESIPGLTTTDKLIFVSSPVEPRKPGETALAQAYARMVAENRPMQITDVQELKLELLGDDYIANRGYLAKLETLHKGVIIWMWLSYRFMGVFINRELAAHVKELVERRIEDTLQRMAFDFDKMRKRREQAIMDMLDRETQAKAENEQDDFEEMPEDPEKLQEWLKKMTKSEHTIEQPSSDLVVRRDEPSGDEVADESLVTELAAEAVEEEHEEEHEARPQESVEPEHNAFQFQEEQQDQQKTDVRSKSGLTPDGL